MAKFIFAFFIIMCSNALFAKSSIMSPVSPPTVEVMNVDISSCSNGCLRDLFDMGYYLSYIAKYTPNDSDTLKSNFQIATNYLDFMILPDVIESKKFKIALLLPQKVIGRYSITSSDTIISYLNTRGVDYDFRVFDCKNEDANNLVSAYNDIRANNYKYVIAILTPAGLKNLASNVNVSTLMYIPTINKEQATEILNVRNINSNFIFGGISYKKQIDIINDYAKSKNAGLIIYNDSSYIGKMIGDLFKENASNIISQDIIDSKIVSSFSQMANKIRRRAKNAIIVLNTSVIKSGLIIPQLSAQEIEPINYISTQINFNPSIFSLTQPDDIKNLIVVNAIGPLNNKLLISSYMLNSNLKYDWVNYSTAIGTEYFLLNQNEKLEKYFNESIKDNQVDYDNRLNIVKNSHFVAK